MTPVTIQLALQFAAQLLAMIQDAHASGSDTVPLPDEWVAAINARNAAQKKLDDDIAASKAGGQS